MRYRVGKRALPIDYRHARFIALQRGFYLCNNACVDDTRCRGWKFDFEASKCWTTTATPTGWDKNKSNFISGSKHLAPPAKTGRAYVSGGFTAGLSVGVDVGPVWSFWTVARDDMVGKAQGLTLALGGGAAGASVTFWLSFDDAGDVREYLGFSIALQLGVSVEGEFVPVSGTMWTD